MKTIIAGSRGWNHYEAFKMMVDEFMDLPDGWQITEVVSGGALGPDTLGELYAKERGIPVKLFKPNWIDHGRSAGYKRNVEMAIYADALIAFWDGESKGTRHMINIAREEGLEIKMFYVGRM